nr:PREDICTED: uncharacterized protein LOC109036006 isoform X3 [Bemisia tabaci]
MNRSIILLLWILTQAQGILIYPDDGSSENEAIPLRPLLITNGNTTEGEETLIQVVRSQVNRILSYTDEKVRAEVLFTHLLLVETQFRQMQTNLQQIISEKAILSAVNKCQSESLWIVKARSAIEDVERRFKIARVTLSNEEAAGATDDFEYSRRLREKRWKTIFKDHKGNWEIDELITKIQSKNSDVKALEDFAKDISVAYSLLSDDIQNTMLTKGTMTGPSLTVYLTKNTKASSAVELLLSLYDFEPPCHAGKKAMPTLIPVKIND